MEMDKDFPLDYLIGFIIELFTNLEVFITKYKKRGQRREQELVIHT